MINKIKNLNIVDYSNYKFNLLVLDKDLKKKYSFCDLLEESTSSDYLVDLIKINIKKAEKTISSYLEEIILIYDEKEIFSSDFTIKKDFENEIDLKKNCTMLLIEASRTVSNSYPEYKLIQSFISNIKIDGQEISDISNSSIYVGTIVINFKFVFIPLKKFNEINNLFKKNNIQINSIHCSSLLKALYYSKKKDSNKNFVFFDVGYEKSTLVIIKKNKLSYLNNIGVGGNHITKDIAKVFKLDHTLAENIKKQFSNSQNGDNLQTDIEITKVFFKKKISINDIRSVILARANEILDLLYKNLDYIKNTMSIEDYDLIFLGDGSKIYNKNMLNFSYDISKFIFEYNTISDFKIFASELIPQDEKTQINLNQKKIGFFEKFFNLFSK